MKSRSRLLSAALLLVLAIAGASALPTATKHALHTQGALHPWFHFGVFLLLAFLLLRVTRSSAIRLVLLCALLLFGYSTEAGESHADGWPIERRDVLLDAAGVLSGAMLTLLLPGQSLRGSQKPA